MEINRIILALLCGSVWNICPIGGTLLSPLLPAISMAGSRSSRWLISFVWFLSGSVSIIPSSAGFFGWDSIGLGLGAWLVSSAVLAVPWALAKSPTGAVIAIIIDAIPPIGLIDWLSPLSSAGLFFPGQGIAGIVGCLLLNGLVTALANVRSKHAAWLWATGAIMTLWIITGNLIYAPPAQPTGWAGIKTELPPSDGNALLSIGNIRSMIVSAQLQAKHAHIVVFPEAMLDNWWPGTQKQIAAAVPQGQLWLFGAQTQAPGARWDAMVSVRRNQADVTPVFKAALPMPISMWQPGFNGSYLPAWWEPATIIDGKRVWANICFDQVLPWVWLEGMTQYPDIVVLPSNGWWAQLWNPAPTIQNTEAKAWVRLMGVSAVFASNKF